MDAKWRVRKRRDEDLLTHLLLVRGLEPDDLELNFEFQRHDPFLLPDMDKAVDLLESVKAAKGKVVIFGDYDADGSLGAALLSIMLDQLTIENSVKLPTRQEGYGLPENGIEKLVEGADLLITVDTGITAVEQLRRVMAVGVPVIVLDHHLPGQKLPKVTALIDPHLPGSRYPFPMLCGCALAYKFLEAASTRFPELSGAFCKWQLDLVAITTVADMMPILGENRLFVHYGLKVLQKNRRPGLQALLSAARVDANQLSAGHLGFTIGPRLNASGRLSDNRPTFELMKAANSAEAKAIADQIEKANRDRQTMVEAVIDEAEQLLFKQNQLFDRLFAVLGKNWPAGVVGLVSGKLTHKYHRPTIVATNIDDEIRGSARSVPACSILECLEHSHKYLLHYGGHAQAAGLSLSAENWPAFVGQAKDFAAGKIAEDELVIQHLADAELHEQELSLSTVDSITKLQPFGLGNAQPQFVLRNAEVESVRRLGSNGDHLKLSLRYGNAKVDAIGFGLAPRYNKDELPTMNVLAKIERNIWQGRESLQLQLVDFSPVNVPIEEVDG